MKLKKSYLNYFLGFFLIFLFNCSENGELEIQNHTNALLKVSIDGTSSYQIDANDRMNKYWKLSTFILNPEEKTVSISGEGLFKFKFNEEKKIKPKETATLYISADAGAIKIENNASVYIKSVYISPSSDYSWGEDDLDGTMAPGDVLYWRVSPGYWDVMLIDQNNVAYQSQNIHVIENHVISLYLSDQNANWKINKTFSIEKEKIIRQNTSKNMMVERIK